MAARWVLKHVYEQQQLDVQQVFEPKLIERDSVGRPRDGDAPPPRDRHHPDRRAQRVSVGFDGSLFTGAVGFIEAEFALDEFELGWAVTSMAVAATVSIFVSGPLADRFGRRTVLRLATCVFARVGVARGALGKFRDADRGAPAQRVRRRCRVHHRADVHRRNLAAGVARPHGVVQPAVHRARHARGVRQQLPHRAVRGAALALHLADWNWRWMLGIGVVAGDPVFFRAVVRSGKPALARDARPAAGGAARAGAAHRQRTRRRASSTPSSFARARSAARRSRRLRKS